MRKNIDTTFHYKRTNQAPLLALNKIKNFAGDTLEQRKLKNAHFAFFAGFASHVIADGIFHPFVLDKVGEYAGNKGDHRALELGLDVLVLQHFTADSGLEFDVQHAKIQNRFDEFKNEAFAQPILEHFSKLIMSIYEYEATEDNISGWVEGLYRLFRISSSGTWPEWFMHLDTSSSFVAKHLDDIKERADDYLLLKKPKDWDVNFLQTSQIHFINDGIPKFVELYNQFLARAYSFVYKDGAPLTETDLPGVNLDTGRPLYIKPTYWS